MPSLGRQQFLKAIFMTKISDCGVWKLLRQAGTHPCSKQQFPDPRSQVCCSSLSWPRERGPLPVLLKHSSLLQGGAETAVAVTA